ncbi:inositol-pentakisphosphate 2-kinase isoform X3 [Octodon degus]|uniref:Inositol-pentakisphosphate 2-kinase n=1 Tax=Octodon degus TaxID=10160 RepID=A0A6P6DU82_OCTDE|nr:inositol-pentakisphosphate 2-kinase isoform X3 [Octodon degus]
MAERLADAAVNEDGCGWSQTRRVAPNSCPRVLTREPPGPRRGMEEEKMDENEWGYHGEGNKSLVVAHAQRCVVLRFLKFPPNRKKTSEEILQHLQDIVDFGKNVMKEFFGENCVHCGEVVQLPLEFVKQLCLKIQSERPESRCDKDLDTLSGYAMCLPNLTRLQTYCIAEHRPILCVEIKPKCGFIPFSSSVTHEMKHKVCRYCMHQHLKVATGKWKQISEYCPLDLFSGNKQRMHFALKSLLQESQNNLKIFKVQMLDLLDIEGLYPLYNRVEQYLEEFPEERKMLQIDGPYDEAFYQKLLDLSTEDDGSVAFALTKNVLAQYDYVQQYRVAMTAKDCSIMIALSPCLQDASSDRRLVVPSSRSRLAFSVSVLDLDLKPYESIPHQYKLDAKIVNYYAKTVHAKDDTVMSTRFKESEDCTLVLHKV